MIPSYASRLKCAYWDATSRPPEASLDGMKRCALELAAEGFSQKDILKMGRDTPAALLGMKPAKGGPIKNR